MSIQLKPFGFASYKKKLERSGRFEEWFVWGVKSA